MSITQNSTIKVAIGVVIGALIAIISGSFVAGTEWGGIVKKSELALKSDKSELDRLAASVSTLSGKVSTLADELNELSAKRREDFVMLKNIMSLAEKTDSRIGTIENNQTWQIQQEVKRLQWQSFKQEPQPTPQNNVNR